MGAASTPVAGSFRDPGGFVFRRGDAIYRQVNRAYRDCYTELIASGLYARLVDSGLLIPHRELEPRGALNPGAYVVIKPDPIPFVSYPYEWCFSQLKDAALATLAAQRCALSYGMSLKDASAYNVQFAAGRPVLVDTLSFERYAEGRPWMAYRQFCEHFLAPLALMAGRDVRLAQLLRVHLDGIPLDLAARLLPWRARLRPGLLLHLWLHAIAQRRYSERALPAGRSAGFTKRAFLGMLDSLEGAVRGLEWSPGRTVWSDYYEHTSYGAEALADKQRLVSAYLDAIAPRSVWDLGANTGRFSRIASARGVPTLAFDADAGAVELAYRQSRADQDRHLLPLLVDFANPSPGVGWLNCERPGVLERAPAGVTVLALALVHHLAIAQGIPFERIAELLRGFASALVIEFVPSEDAQVQRLFAARGATASDYSIAAFEAAFAAQFATARVETIRGTGRRLYLMRRIER